MEGMNKVYFFCTYFSRAICFKVCFDLKSFSHGSYGYRSPFVGPVYVTFNSFQPFKRFFVGMPVAVSEAAGEDGQGG